MLVFLYSVGASSHLLLHFLAFFSFYPYNHCQCNDSNDKYNDPIALERVHYGPGGVALRNIRYSMPPHQQPMGIHSIRRARK